MMYKTNHINIAILMTKLELAGKIGLIILVILLHEGNKDAFFNGITKGNKYCLQSLVAAKWMDFVFWLWFICT